MQEVLSQWNNTIPLVDPLCGSGTFLIEAINQILEVPLNFKESYLFENWLDFRREIYLYEKIQAKKKVIKFDTLPKVIGCEINKNVFNQAKVNVRFAGLAKYIELQNHNFTKIKFNASQGLILCNPPYGKKLGNEQELIPLYENIGVFLKKNFSGWEFWLLSGNPRLTRYLKMKSSVKIPISNGGIDCRWIKYLIR